MITYFADEDVLESLSEEHTLSPEDFLVALEEQLETGELALDDAIALINDYMSRNCKHAADHPRRR